MIRVDDVPDQVVSNVFLRMKKNESYRMILNLKDFNKNIEKIHFKMETLSNAISLMKQDCFFGSIDLKDAYFSINIHNDDRKYFRFRFDKVLYEVHGLPQGYKDSPRLFSRDSTVDKASDKQTALLVPWVLGSSPNMYFLYKRGAVAQWVKSAWCLTEKSQVCVPSSPALGT